MRKLVYFLLLFSGVINFCACEEESGNPGDFSLKPELSVLALQTMSGKDIPLKVLRTIDTTYVRFYTKTDTLKDENGKAVITESGKYITRLDTVYYEGKIKAKFTEIETIILDSPADTFKIELESNSKWQAPIPSTGGKSAWFFTTRLAGGGNGTATAYATRNRGNRRSVSAKQYIFTRDSTAMYLLTFNQRGEKE